MTSGKINQTWTQKREFSSKEVRKKCIEADLVPYVVAAAPFVAQMDQVIIVAQFVRTWGRRITSLGSGNLGDFSEEKRIEDASRCD